MGANGVFCTKGVDCTRDEANKIENIEAGFVTDRSTAFNIEAFEKISKNGKINYKSKMIFLFKTAVYLQFTVVMGRGQNLCESTMNVISHFTICRKVKSVNGIFPY